MTNKEIRLCIEKAAADCANALNLLAYHVGDLEDADGDDVESILEASRHVSTILGHLQDDFADETNG